MVHNATRSRTKSVQFEKSVISLDTDGSSSRDGATSPPVPGSRTSSLPLGSESKENIIRHYRSMLNIEDPPKLPMAKPLSYGSLYPKPGDSVVVHRHQRIPMRRPHDTICQAPFAPGPGIFALLLHTDHSGGVLLTTRCCSFKRYSQQSPSPRQGLASGAHWQALDTRISRLERRSL